MKFHSNDQLPPYAKISPIMHYLFYQIKLALDQRNRTGTYKGFKVLKAFLP